jgi:hypothetical protein
MYYIYHIPNVKIGCTKNPSNRIKQQTSNDYEILETHTDIHIASQREIELQKQYGYSIDKSTYKQSIENDAGKQDIAGRASATKQWKENRDRELEKCSKGGKVNAELNGKPVIMCDMNGNAIKEFKNRADAANFVNGFKSTLVGTINKQNRSYKGYKWISPL